MFFISELPIKGVSLPFIAHEVTPSPRANRPACPCWRAHSATNSSVSDVVQPNLFYRVGRSPVLNAAKVFIDKAEMAKLLRLIQQLTPDAVVRDAGAWLQFLSQHNSIGAAVRRMAIAQTPANLTNRLANSGDECKI
jgi:hypothetical protein